MFDGIFKPIAFVLGQFLNLIFTWMDAIGIGNIGIAIIIFTVIIKTAMFPLTLSQQKTAKISQLIQPEIKAIRAKYKGKRDVESQQAQNDEIKAVYAKYGASQTGGCVQLIIQIPILFALYQVFRNMPLYVGKLNTLLHGVLGSLKSDPAYLDKMNSNFGAVNWENADEAITALDSFGYEQWDHLRSLFPDAAQIIGDSSSKILDMNTFLGINVTDVPGQVMGIAILVPILAGVSQFISAWLGQSTNSMGAEQSPLANKLMAFTTPVISVIIGFRVPAGLGLYWITTAVVTIVFQLFINRYYKNMSVDDLIAQNKEKQKKKMEKMQKKGVSSDTLVKGASMKTKTLGDRQSSSGRAGGGGFGSFRDKANLGQSDTGKGKTASGGGAPPGGELKGSPPSGKSPGGRPPSGDPVTETKTGSSGGSKRSGKGSDDSSLRDKVFTAAATSSKNVKSKGSPKSKTSGASTGFKNVQPEEPPKKKFSLFGRKKQEEPTISQKMNKTAGGNAKFAGRRVKSKNIKK